MSTGPDPGTPNGGEFRQGAAPLSAEDLITLNEQIAAMANAGLPLDQGLSALAREEGGARRTLDVTALCLVGVLLVLSIAWIWLPWSAWLILPLLAILAGVGALRWIGSASGRLTQVTEHLAHDLRGGFTLPQAMERLGGRVPPYYAALLSAGIRSGRIHDVLGTLTLYARALGDFRATILSALLYPTIVLVLGIVLLLFLSSFILPTYMEIFDSFKMKLPFFTEVVFWIAQHALPIIAIPLCLIVACLIAERLWLRRTPRGRRLSARFVYSLPIAGSLLRSSRLAAFTELLGILVEQGVPLPEALRLAAEASTDPLLAQGVLRVENEISQGTPLGRALHDQSLVPDLVVWMVGFGERQGTLPAALRHVAQMYRRQAEIRLALLRTVLPPLLMVMLAVVLGTLFIFGLMAPFLELLDGLSGGGR